MARQSLMGQGILIIEASRLHSDTPRSVGLLWTGDRSVAETSTLQHTTQTCMPPAGFEHTIPAGELSQTDALDRAVTRIGKSHDCQIKCP